MPTSKQKTQRRPSTNKKTLDQQEDYEIPKGFWLLVTLGLLSLYSLYLVTSYTLNTGNLPASINPIGLLNPISTSIFIVIFGTLYFFAIWRKIVILTLAKASAYAIITITILAIVLSFFFEIKNHSSSDNFYFLFTILFHNPFASGLISLIAIIGSINLLIHITRLNR